MKKKKVDFEEHDKISRFDDHVEDEKTGRNNNKSNPFTKFYNQIDQQGDDQEAMQEGFKADYEGFAPIQARRELRKKALFDVAEPMNMGSGVLPGAKDPSQGLMGMGTGEEPDPDKITEKRWSDVWDKSQGPKKFTRKKNNKPTVEDQTHLDAAGDNNE